MSKFIMINDNHWGVRNSSILFEDHIAKFFRYLLKYCIDNDISVICQMGDFMDRRKDVNIRTLWTVKQILQEFEDANITIHMAPGNHDNFYKNMNEVNSVNLLFNEFKNITVYNIPTEIKIYNETVLMVPWISPDQEEEFVDIITKSNADVCLGHFEFSGFMFMQGVESEHGHNHSIVSHFRNVYSGHYHSKSVRDNVTYCGAQYDLTWIDYNEKKYFHVYDTSDSSCLPVEYKEKIFYKIFFDKHLSTKKQVDSIDFSLYTNKIIKVVVKHKTNQTLFDYFLELLYQANPHDVAILDDRQEFTESTNSVIITNSTQDIIKSFVSEIILEDIDKTKLLNIVNKIYIEVETSDD